MAQHASSAAAVAFELDEIAELLHIDHASLRGIALLERLLTDAASPLFGKDVKLVRQQLRRVCLRCSTDRRRRRGIASP